MDSLELIQRYVEAGYGIGLSLRAPGQKLSSKIRMLELPDFPSVTLGALYRDVTGGADRVLHAFLDAIKRQAQTFANGGKLNPSCAKSDCYPKR